MNLRCLTLIIALFSLQANAQDQAEIHDTVICKSELALGNNLLEEDPDAALKHYETVDALVQLYLDRQKKKSSDLPDAVYLAYQVEAKSNLAWIYSTRGNIVKAKELYLSSYAINQIIGDQKDVARMASNLAYLEGNQGNTEEALEYYNKGLKISTSIGDKLGTAMTYSNIAALHWQNEGYEKALEHCLMSLRIYEELGDMKGMARTMYNLGGIYYDFDKLDRAKDYFSNCVVLALQIKDVRLKARTFAYLGKIAADNEDYQMALDYQFKVVYIYQGLNNEWARVKAMIRLAELLFINGKVTEAEDKCEAALTLAGDNYMIEAASDGAKLLYRIYKSQEEFEAALRMYEFHIEMRDSMRNEDKTAEIIRLQARYEFEKELLELEKKWKAKHKEEIKQLRAELDAKRGGKKKKSKKKDKGKKD